MKQGWEVQRLKDAFEIKPSKTIPRSKFNPETIVSFLPMEDLGVMDKEIKATKKRKLSEVVSSSYTFFADNDVLLAKITPCFENGKLGIAKNLTNGVGFGSSEYIVFRDKGLVTPEYLFYFLSNHDFRREATGTMGGAVGHKRLSKEFVENYSIPIPNSLPEQQRIVAILDEAFAAIAKAKVNAEKNLQNAYELFESYLHAVFANPGEDWEEKTLKEVTTKIGSGATPRGGKENYKKEGVTLVRSMNVHDLFFKDKNLAFIDNQQAKELDNVSLQENDVLLNITGASVARCCTIPKEYLPARVNQHVSIIRPNRDFVDPTFLNLLLISEYYKNQLLVTGEQGATRQAITKAQLEVFNINFPKSLGKQQQIVSALNNLLDSTKKLETLYKQKLNDLEELKKSILQKAFSGELKTLEKELA